MEPKQPEPMHTLPVQPLAPQALPTHRLSQHALPAQPLKMHALPMQKLQHPLAMEGICGEGVIPWDMRSTVRAPS